MPETARILAIFSLFRLLASVGTWTTMLRGPLLERLDSKKGPNVYITELALQVLVFAFTLAGLAAAFAIAGLMFP